MLFVCFYVVVDVAIVCSLFTGYTIVWSFMSNLDNLY